MVSQATFQGLDSHMQPEVSRRDSSDRDLYPLPESSIRQHWNPSSKLRDPPSLSTFSPVCEQIQGSVHKEDVEVDTGLVINHKGRPGGGPA